MSDGNTMIDNVMAGRGMGQAGDYDDEYLEEDHALEQEEEKMMHEEEVTSDEDETDERQMLNTALVNSVVETSKKKQGASEATPDDSSQRYSLRRRRRPTGEASEKPERAQGTKKKAEISESTRSAPPSAASPDPATRGTDLTSQPPPSARVKAGGVPAVTIHAPSSLTAPIPPASSLPPALQPPSQRQNIPPKPPKSSTTNATRPPSTRAKAPTTKAAQRLAPAARLGAPKAPHAPDTALCGVPNPLSNPFPMSAVPTAASNGSSNNGRASYQTFKAGTKLTVPCPLPPSTFESNVRQLKPQSAAPAKSSMSKKTAPKKYTVTTAPKQVTGAPHPGSEPDRKKMVTISTDLPVQNRGRIFSIDMDPASLDFSVLDPDPESGVPAPASADLPLLSGSRDRAYSFECFAFGINADEPLPDYGGHQGDRNHDGYSGARPRGDSIIFDPVSFQDGGIHEEHALTTRDRRGMSIDLDSIVSSMPAPTGAPPTAAHAPAQNHSSSANANYGAPSALSSAPPAPVPAPSATYRVEAQQPAPAAQMGGYAPPNGRPATGASHHPGAPVPHSNGYPHHQYPYPPPQPSNSAPGNSHPPYTPGHVPSGPNGSNGTLSNVVGSASQTFQMELLNKDGRIGIYLPDARRERIARFHAKRKMRIWRKRIKYDCRKKLADSRPRIKGRFVKRSDMDED